jgi:4-hydroxy-tetrahydrodipicolinate reductase
MSRIHDAFHRHRRRRRPHGPRARSRRICTIRAFSSAAAPNAATANSSASISAPSPASAPLMMNTSETANLAADKAEVWIDFTSPEGTIAALDALIGTPVKAAIIGTTGLTPAQEAKGRRTRQAHRHRALRQFQPGREPARSARRTSRATPRPRVGHRDHRSASPPQSRRALRHRPPPRRRRRARPQRETLRRAPQAARRHHRPERKEGGIGFSAIRGGGIVGEHDVRFIAEREILTLSHQATDRAVFADGALAAALWVATQAARPLLDARCVGAVAPPRFALLNANAQRLRKAIALFRRQKRTQPHLPFALTDQHAAPIARSPAPKPD